MKLAVRAPRVRLKKRRRQNNPVSDQMIDLGAMLGGVLLFATGAHRLAGAIAASNGIYQLTRGREISGWANLRGRKLSPLARMAFGSREQKGRKRDVRLAVGRANTKSAAHRIGLVPCLGCNTAGLPSEQVVGECAWCWDPSMGAYTRFIAVDKAIEYAQEHGIDLDAHDLPTPAASREALERKIADTDPAPPDTEKSR